MWPELFGTGSELGLFVAGSTLAGLTALVWYAMRAGRTPVTDPVADLWRRCEQGDLTSWEAARLFRLLAGQQAALEAQQAAAKDGGRRRALVSPGDADGMEWGAAAAWAELRVRDFDGV